MMKKMPVFVFCCSCAIILFAADPVKDTTKLPDTTPIKSDSVKKGTSIEKSCGGMLKNPGFEEGLNNWRMKKEQGGEGICRLECELVHSGKQALSIKKTGGQGSLRLINDQYIPVSSTNEYCLQAYCHFSELFPFGIHTSPIRLEVTGYDENEKEIWRKKTGTGQSVPILSGPGEWQWMALWFKPETGSKKIKASLVIAGNPLSLVADDFSLTLRNLQEEAKLYPRFAVNPEPKLSWEETLRFLETQPESSAEVKKINGIPRLCVDGKTEPPIIYRMRGKKNHGYCKDFNEAGIKIQMVMVPVGGRPAENEIWKGAGIYDFEPVDSRIKFALQGNPDGKIIVSLWLGPYTGWEKEHPGDACLDSDGKPAMGRSEREYFGPKREENDRPVWSYYSQTLRREMNETIIAVIQFLKKQPYYKSIIGFSLAGGHDGQWLNTGTVDDHLIDYGPAAIKSFRDFMRRKYGTEERFAAELKLPNTSIDTLMPPPAEARRSSIQFRDPLQDRLLADYAEFLSREKAELIISFGETIKKNAGKPVIVTTYYCEQIRGSGRNLDSADTLRASDYIDIFHSVLNYNPWRQPGALGTCGNCLGSLALYDKIFLQEMDLRTWRTKVNHPALILQEGFAMTMQDFAAINEREIGMAVAKNMGAYYYDMSGGWFHDEGIMKNVADCHKLYQNLVEKKDTFTPDVAVIVDERSCHWVSEKIDALSALNSCLWPAYDALSVSGVPFDVHQLRDLLIFPQLKNYKVYIFLNTFYISKKERDFIKENLEKNGKTLVWNYACGYLSEDGKSTGNISELTGIKTGTEENKQQNLMAETIETAGFPVKGLPPALGSSVGQSFWVADNTAIPFARYREGNAVAGAWKQFAGWKSVYTASPGALLPALINNIALDAGAYVCAEPGVVAWVNDNFLCLHGTRGGRITIRLPRPVALVKDAFTGEVLVKSSWWLPPVRSFQFNLELKKTYWFILE